MPENRPALAMPQSLRPCGAPPFTQGRLCDGRRVRPYIHLPIVIAYLKLFVGGRPRRPVQPCVIANLWFPVGADSISTRAISRNHPTARRGQDPSLRTNYKRATTLRGVGDAAPYKPTYGGCRGEHCSPAEPHVAAKLHGRTLCAPTPKKTAAAQQKGRCRKVATPVKHKQKTKITPNKSP